MIFDARPPEPGRWQRHWAPSARYWMRTEVHVHALAVSASVLLSFFPFLIVMISLCRYGFHWPAAVNAIYVALNDYFPGELGGFIKRNLVAVIESRGPMLITPLFLFLFPGHGRFYTVAHGHPAVRAAPKKQPYLLDNLPSHAP